MTPDGPRNNHKERLIRALLLLVTSGVLTGIGVLAGIPNLSSEYLIYACMLGVVAVALVVSRIGAKWIVRRLEGTKSGSIRPDGPQNRT